MTTSFHRLAAGEQPAFPGERIRLTRMDDDPDPIEIGTLGTVERVVSLGAGHWQVGVEWDGGRKLHLVLPLDEFDVIG